MPLDVLAHAPPPAVSFASDNSATVHPVVLEALAAANEGHALAYGDDRWTHEATERVRDCFGVEAEVLFVWGGTGANVVGLATVLRSSDAVVCTDIAHINVDEGGAAERFIGTKLLDVASTDGKLTVAQLEATTGVLGDEHHSQPRVLSLTQATEVGTVYRPAEVAELSEAAHAHGMVVHMDGARIANAVVACGGDVRAVTAGVDVLSFGGTKNGMMYGEAVVFLDPGLAAGARFVRKQATQLPSKARFIAAQFSALLTDDLWLANAAQANAMATRLHDRLRHLEGLELGPPPQVNSLFPVLPREVIAPLQAWCPFYEWDPAFGRVRWMTAWDTTPDDVDRFAAGVIEAVG